MQPTNSIGSKFKSGIPQPVPKKAPVGSNQTHVVLTSTSEDGHPTQLSSRNPEQAQSTSSHPLAAAMKTKKKANKKNQISESWADVKTESQSQRMQGISQSDSSRRKEDIEKQLRQAESQIEVMSELIEKRERYLEETKNAADDKIGELEDRIMNQEGILAEHGIDPVTGLKVPMNEENKKKVESTKKITKKTVQAMREKLREMNHRTECFLADIENTMQYLSSLEDASDRAGPFSEETQAMIDRLGDDEDAISKVYDENSAPGDRSKKSKGRTDGDHSSGEEDDGENNEAVEAAEAAEGNDGQFFITNAAAAEGDANDADVRETDGDKSEGTG